MILSARIKSLQTHLLLLCAVSVVIALVIACVGFLTSDLRDLHQAKRRQLQAMAEIVGFNSAAVLLIGDADAGAQLLAPLSAQPTIDAAALYSEDGQLLAQYTAPDAQAAPEQADAAAGHRYNPAGDLEYSQDVAEGGQQVGRLYLRANMQDVWQQTRARLLLSFGVFAVSLAAAFPLAYFLARTISRPILDLAQTADQITGHGDFTVRVQSQSQNEIGTLYRAFNGMIEHVDAANRAIKASQDELEQRVELRTAELQDQIRERERIQQDLILAKEAAEAGSRAKSEFLANMSHEIRTPMNGVLGMTELVLDTELSRDQRESMEMVRSSADSLMVVINDILDFSKIEAGKLELDPMEFMVRDVLEGALTSLALRAHDKDLELNCDIKPNVPQRVIGDAGRLRQVIVNLIGNAIKFTNHGEITLRAELASESSAGFRLRFSVLDTGIGIPPEKQRVIFEAFSQADGSMTRRYGGTGLGLTISSKLVALMGGQLQVDSEEGKGSTFHFDADFGKPDPTAASAVPRLPANLHDLAVLVVDDNATNRRILEETLHNWGARPTLVDGGQAALVVLRMASLANKPFPLLLVDAMMPEMDGFTLIAQIRREPLLDRPAIMMLSSAQSLGDGKRCRELGIASYLVKPVRSSELYSAILAALAGSPHGLPTPSAALPAEGSPTKAVSLAPSLRILLAEDNLVNQRVAVRILEKRGYSVTVADNGKKALAALDRESFDMVLMDVQMPEVDGWEATRAIRLKEATSGGHLPIIAMTAHAMKGDRERCLAAGMDDYISKPIDPELLAAALRRNAPLLQPPAVVSEANTHAELNAGNSQSSAHAPVAEQSPSVDRAALLARLDGETELMQEVIELFLSTSPDLLRKIEAAVADADCPRTAQAAHELKGAASALAAGPCAKAAEQLELVGGSGDLKGADQLLAILQDELQRLRLALETTNQE